MQTDKQQECLPLPFLSLVEDEYFLHTSSNVCVFSVTILLLQIFRSQFFRNNIFLIMESFFFFNQIFSLEQKRNFTDLFSLSSHIWQKAIVPIFLEFQLFHYYCNFSYSLLLLSLHVSNMEQITLKKNIKDRRVRIDNLQKYFLSLFFSCLGRRREKNRNRKSIIFSIFFLLDAVRKFSLPLQKHRLSEMFRSMAERNESEYAKTLRKIGA